MKKTIISLLLFFAVITMYGQAAINDETGLSVKWEELTSLDFIKAVGLSAKTCIIPLGIIEKHGPHMPLGTDMIDVREICKRAAENEYAILFPPFYFGQIYEARQQPGTVAYSTETVWNVLQETCDELHRNGIEKIILVNGHGGNSNLLPYFCQTQLEKRKGYAVFLFQPRDSREFEEELQKLRQTDWDGHAGETETSLMLANRPELVHLDRANVQSGVNQARLKGLSYAYTAIWWYAQYSNHYAGDGSFGTLEMGKLLMDEEVRQLAEMIKSVKADQTVIELQNKFYKDTENPLGTEQ